MSKSILRPTSDGHYTIRFDGETTLAAGACERFLGPLIENLPKRNSRSKILMARTFIYMSWLCARLDRVTQHRDGRHVYVSYPRSKGDFDAITRYGNSHMTYRNVVRIVDRACELGWVEPIAGQRPVPDRGIPGERSRCRPIDWFLEQMLALDVRPTQIICADRNLELVIMKAATDGSHRRKRRIDYHETAETREIRRLLRKVNKANKSHEFVVSVPTVAMSSIEHQGSTEPMSDQLSNSVFYSIIGADSAGDFRKPLQLHGLRPRFKDGVLSLNFTRQLVLRRVFNDSRWDSGGRFYCAAQNLPSAWRCGILIDGEQTVEVDYSAFHLRMLYHILDREPPCDGELYLDDSLFPDCHDRVALRKVVKLATNTCLNAKSERSAVGAIVHDDDIDWSILPSIGADDAAKVIIDFIKRRHPVLTQDLGREVLGTRKLMFSGVGSRLQFIDSQIAQRIMLRFVRVGKAILPIHDSFVVKASDRVFLERAMVEEYRAQPELNGHSPQMKTKAAASALVSAATSAVRNGGSPAANEDGVPSDDRRLTVPALASACARQSA